MPRPTTAIATEESTSEVNDVLTRPMPRRLIQRAGCSRSHPVPESSRCSVSPFNSSGSGYEGRQTQNVIKAKAIFLLRIFRICLSLL